MVEPLGTHSGINASSCLVLCCSAQHRLNPLERALAGPLFIEVFAFFWFFFARVDLHLCFSFAKGSSSGQKSPHSVSTGGHGMCP